MKLVKLVAPLALFVAMGFGLALALEASGPTESNIVEVLEELNGPGGPYEGEFDILLAALAAADPIVVDTLTGNSHHTFFAPNAGAWDDLPPALLPSTGDGAFSALSSHTEAITPETLTQILLYHIIHGNRSYLSLIRAQQARTLQGEFLYLVDGTLMDTLGRPANFVATDIEAANGVIHIIDKVLLPFPP